VQTILDRNYTYAGATSQSPALELDRVSRRYGTVTAVDNVTLSLARGEFLTLLGPSGSGKTSTLRLIGGFETIDAGEIRINGVRADHLPPYGRNTATIFQSGALFPHKTVEENVAFGLRMRKLAKPEIARRVAEALRIVRLDGLANRYPEQLSGGQKQRVALARSMAVRPAVLLFDEPLSALDLSLRLQLRSEIKRLHEETGFSAIYVTHDQSEAMAMSDRVAVMHEGRIEQIDRPETVFHQAANEFVHTFVGESSCLSIIAGALGYADDTGVPLDLNLETPISGGSRRLYFRPAQIRLGAAASVMPNNLRAQVVSVEFLGDVHRHHLRAGTSILIADHPGSLGLGPGDWTVLGWPSSMMRIFS
jgi:ABC-type Fe3+/spermidine/putrescine transport system ATPase subunit